MLKNIVLFFVIFPVFAFAAENGKVGETSTGSVQISIVIPPRIDVKKSSTEKSGYTTTKNFDGNITTITKKDSNGNRIEILIPEL